MALVICDVFFTDLIRRRMSRVLGMTKSQKFEGRSPNRRRRQERLCYRCGSTARNPCFSATLGSFVTLFELADGGLEVGAKGVAQRFLFGDTAHEVRFA